jgi:hypothetical protein
MAQTGDKLILYLHSHYKSIMMAGTVKLTGDQVLLKGCKVPGDEREQNDNYIA